jgi:cytochrome c oxidase assembly protein subunit 15
MTVMLLVQVLLGILTIVNSVGKIPVIYGVLHQAGALLLLAFVLFSTYHINRETTS